MIKKTDIERICKRLGVDLVSFSFLAKGEHNSNYLIETNKSKLVLRVENNKQFNNLKKEYDFLMRAKIGLGPKVLLFDKSYKILQNDYLVEEFVEGRHPSNEYPTDDFVRVMANWFRKLHSIKRKSSSYFLMSKVRPYYNNYLKYKDNIKDIELKRKLELYIDNGLKILKKNNDIFVNRKTFSLLHNDSSSENIFYKKGYVRLIDWEFVDYGLPERELVYFIDSYKLTKKQISLFFKTYGYPDNKKSRMMLQMTYLMLLFSSIGYSLWNLDILNKNKSSNKEKSKRMTRLIRDITLLKENVKEL